MGIRLLYGLKTDDNSYLNDFYPARRLKEAAYELGIDYEGRVFGPNTKIEDCLGFTEGHITLLRGELPLKLYSAVEKHCIKLVNPKPSVELADDKLASAGFFKRLGAEHPETMAISQNNKEAPLAMPFICKPRFGRMGRGIVLINNTNDWQGFLSSSLIKKEPYLAQSYISESYGRDIRFFFADFPDGQFKTVLRQGRGLESNAHRGGIMLPFNPPAFLAEEARRLFQKSALVYGTVDFLFGNKDNSLFYVCELNACPGFEAIEECLNIDAAKAILLSSLGGPDV